MTDLPTAAEARAAAVVESIQAYALGDASTDVIRAIERAQQAAVVEALREVMGEKEALIRITFYRVQCALEAAEAELRTEAGAG